MTVTPHELATIRIQAVRNQAVRADPARISAAIADLVTRSRLDPDGVAFLARARTFVLATTRALEIVLDIHTPDVGGTQTCSGCRRTRQVCGTVADLTETLVAGLAEYPAGIDRAEAWRRADAWVHHDTEQRFLISMDEFPDGFIARPVPDVPLDDAAGPYGEILLVIDKTTGRVTRWPRLSATDLAERYRAYRRRA